MAIIGILFPVVLHFTHTEVHFEKLELALSRFSSCTMLVEYASYLFFQLKSHSNMYDFIDEESENNEDEPDDEEATGSIFLHTKGVFFFFIPSLFIVNIYCCCSFFISSFL